MTTEVIMAPTPELQPAALFTHTKGSQARPRVFTAQINNDHTRRAYLNATRRVAEWCDGRGIRQLADVQTSISLPSSEDLHGQHSPPTVKQHLAAQRMLFDWRLAFIYDVFRAARGVGRIDVEHMAGDKPHFPDDRHYRIPKESEQQARSGAAHREPVGQPKVKGERKVDPPLALTRNEVRW